MTSLRSSALVRAAAEAPTIPTSPAKLDADTLARLEAFAASEGLTLDAALAVVRRAQRAARTELRAADAVEAAVAAALRDRRLGYVGSSAPADPEVETAVSAALADRKARIRG